MDSVSEPSYVAYIDEAGDAGNKVGEGSSHFITMAAVIVPTAEPYLATELFEHAHVLRRGKTAGKPFRKFSESSDPDNFLLTSLFRAYNITVCQVAFHKPSMGEIWIRKNNRREYCYLCKLTLERVSWFARDAAHPNDPGDT